MNREDDNEIHNAIMKRIMDPEAKRKYIEARERTRERREERIDRSRKGVSHLKALLENIIQVETNPNRYELTEKAHAIMDKIKGISKGLEE